MKLMSSLLSWDYGVVARDKSQVKHFKKKIFTDYVKWNEGTDQIVVRENNGKDVSESEGKGDRLTVLRLDVWGSDGSRHYRHIECHNPENDRRPR